MLVFRPIQERDITNKISTGSHESLPLKNFLKNEALSFHESNIVKTYVLADKNCRVWGYISLMTSEISLNEDQKPTENPRSIIYKSFPAVKIARLLIDKSMRLKGYGKQMLDWAINHVTLTIMPHVGCRFLAVDAKKDSILFYKKNGFTILNSSDNLMDNRPLMFIDLHKLQNIRNINQKTNSDISLALTT